MTYLWVRPVFRNVKQLLLEWHVFNTYPAREEFPRMASTVRDLDKAGFQHFYKKPFIVEMDWEMFGIQSDMGYVNGNFIKREHSWDERRRRKRRRKGTHCHDHTLDCEWCSTCSFLNHWTTTAPACLSDLIQLHAPSRQLRSSTDTRLLRLSSALLESPHRRAFYCQAPLLWNNQLSTLLSPTLFFHSMI